MFRGGVKLFQNALCRSTRDFSCAPNTGRILGACVLERNPVITPDPPAWEVEYQEWAAEKRRKKVKELPALFVETKRDEETSEDLFEPAPRTTAADAANDTKSLDRALDKRLYLFVRHKQGHWHFPHTSHNPGETMRQTAERALSEYWAGDGEDAYFIGNAPSAHHPFEEDTAGAVPGDTAFFYRASYLADEFDMERSDVAREYQWLTKEEVVSQVACSKLQTLFKDFLK
ncbi:hypothetical protein CYMTET_42039 [Cymbomonas tetramitiformis]|uniref:Large ribosomal subunit protein mL46 n=1 Tax=Cymbomonas tetramitiformis TaxID=36881 RepID=A0AAE0F1D8_9CHLO|nr:hypothetical protein CYMTET_42039 [Cymbomonas tetramitiformis]